MCYKHAKKMLNFTSDWENLNCKKSENIFYIHQIDTYYKMSIDSKCWARCSKRELSHAFGM